MKTRFLALCKNLGEPTLSFETLSDAYATPIRAYHNLDPIAACLKELDTLKSPMFDLQRHDWQSIELALWLHDVIYDPKAVGSDNEEKSALFLLGHFPTQQTAARLVRVTDHKTTPETTDEALIIDIDLSILGQSESVFDTYEQAIREEYNPVPDDVFRVGRSRVLTHFLERKAIYTTPEFYEKYEEMARKNLERSLRKLAM